MCFTAETDRNPWDKKTKTGQSRFWRFLCARTCYRLQNLTNVNTSKGTSFNSQFPLTDVYKPTNKFKVLETGKFLIRGVEISGVLKHGFIKLWHRHIKTIFGLLMHFVSKKDTHLTLQEDGNGVWCFTVTWCIISRWMTVVH